MSRLGEFLAWHLNRAFPALPMHRTLEAAKHSVITNQQWSYEEARQIVMAFDPYWDLHDKHVLDIGAGLGGKLPFYIKEGAKFVTGIDDNEDTLHLAYQHINSFGLAPILSLVCSDAAMLPFPDNSFNTVVSINVFEHIDMVDLAVCEAYRVLEPGGMAFLHLPPYFSAWGPHLENWIHFPWPHLLFSERTLMRVVQKQDSLNHLNDRFVTSAKIDLQVDHVPNVNRVTLNHFRNLVKKSGFKIVQLKLLPIGYDFLNSDRSIIKRIAHWILNIAADIPLLQEVVVTKMVYVLQK